MRLRIVLAVLAHELLTMPCPGVAAKVANGVLSDRPPIRMRIGRQLLVYTQVKPFLPSRAIDRLLSARFKLDRLGARR